jgi:tripartite ATP-independent transporter DctM subunit
MMTVAVILVTVFTILVLLGIPIAVAIGFACLVTLYSIGIEPTHIVARKMVNAMDSFALLAIPLFVFSGLLMGRGGLARRLMEFASALLGRFPNGLAYVNTLTCMFFGSISGSATAAVSSIGGFIIPEMCRKGYDRDFSIALTVSSATTGLIIPPSNIMIVYAVACGNVSIAALFAAGVIPGIFVGLCIMAACFILSFRTTNPPETAASFGEILATFRRAFLTLFLVVLIFGGILGGIFTATEAAAVAVAYAFVLSVFVYREVRFRDIPKMLTDTCITTAIVMFLIGVSSGLSWILATTDIPEFLGRLLTGVSENRIVLLLLINLLLLFIGTFMDMTPAVLIMTPILLPVVRSLGMTDIQFGIMMITNLCIGLYTPPVGACLFIGCSVGGRPIMSVTGKMIPFFLAMLFALLVITFYDELSLWLPRVSGLFIP